MTNIAKLSVPTK